MSSPKKLLTKALRRHDQGDVAGAIEQLREVVALAPKNLDGHFFLGTFLAETRQLVEAKQHLLAARAIDSRSLQILNNLGNLHRMLGEMDEALACYKRATQLDPMFVQAWMNLGFIHFGLGHWQEALDSFTEIDGARSSDADIVFNMAQAYCELGQTDRALALYAKLVTLDPGDRRGAAIALARLQGKAAPERHSDALVLATYRPKAQQWDSDVNRPGDTYFGPAHLARILEGHLPGTRTLDVLDLGCGTGNCGPFLVPHARQLVGVDLSPEMLKVAQSKALYSELMEAEIGNYLAQGEARFDLVVAAGVLIMFSQLDTISAQIGRRLKPGGLFAFTLYRSSGPDIEIRSNNHFGHSRSYVERVMAACGLSVVEVNEVVHETANGQEQPGFSILLRKLT